MPSDEYLRFDPSIEQLRPDEAEITRAVVASIERTNASSFAARQHAIRQQHAKGQGYLKGELTVLDGLPDHLRQGMFASSGSHPVIVRLSTAFGDLRSDRIRVPRGMAIKILGVSGERALPDDTSTNQDFLLVNHKSYFSDAAAYLNTQRSFELQPFTPDVGLRLVGAAARALVKLRAATGIPIPMAANALGDPGNHILGETFYSQGALRFGDYIVRLSLAPVSESLRWLTGKPCHDDDDALLRSVVDYFGNNAAEYELRAQLGTDLARTSIEDASIDWPEEIAPPQPLARLVLPPQAADSPARRADADEVLSFDPWRCLADHRPLGSIMRLRKEAYAASRVFRHERNGKPMTEPKDISEFPD